MIRYFLSPTLTLYVTDGQYYTEVSYFAETSGDVCERAEQRLTKPQNFSSVFPYHPQHFAYEIPPEQYYSKDNKNLLKIQARARKDENTMQQIVINRLNMIAEGLAEGYIFEEESLDELYPRFEAEITALSGETIRIDDEGYYRVDATYEQMQEIARVAWGKIFN